MFCVMMVVLMMEEKLRIGGRCESVLEVCRVVMWVEILVVNW